MAARKIPYIHRFSGDVRIVTKQSAKKLNEDWSPAEFTKNDLGQDVMRIELNGATVEISEHTPMEGAHNGNQDTK